MLAAASEAMIDELLIQPRFCEPLKAAAAPAEDVPFQDALHGQLMRNSSEGEQFNHPDHPTIIHNIRNSRGPAVLELQIPLQRMRICYSVKSGCSADEHDHSTGSSPSLLVFTSKMQGRSHNVSGHEVREKLDLQRSLHQLMLNVSNLCCCADGL